MKLLIRYVLLYGLWFTLSLSGDAQPPAVIGVLTLSGLPKQGALEIGDKLTAQLALHLSPGFHISSLTQPDGGPRRTEIRLPRGQPFALAGHVQAPLPQKRYEPVFEMGVEFYTAVVIFTLPLKVIADVDPGAKLVVEISYQACTEDNCMMPSTLKVEENVPADGRPPPPKGK